MIELKCTDFDGALAALQRIGARLDMIMPADDPHVAELSNGDVHIRLVGPPRAEIEGTRGSRDVEGSRGSLDVDGARGTRWRAGRAGMLYRDLIPERPGFIASHIRVPDGGPVADYVHFHDIQFQIIYCYKGWVRLVYEDQGEPFVMREGGCVLQPPKIRHRVLACSPGLEVVEVASPAVHATFVEHGFTLPTGASERTYDGQRFVHLERGFADDAIESATGGLARMRVRRDVQPITHPVFGFVLHGTMSRDGQPLVATDAFFGTPVLSAASPDLEWLEVAM